MKRVLFKKIWIKNFLSIGDKPLEIALRSGLNVITGVNYDKEDSKNGVGKSSVADALFFALFGTTIRELKKEEIVNNINQKDCKVIVSFDVINEGNKTEYVVMRSIAPTKLKLVKNGENVTKSSMPKTTAEISRIISSTAEVFENAVIMTVNNTIPFMGQKKVVKRKFIEGILNLGVFSEMLLMARADLNNFKKDQEIEQSKRDEVNKTLEIYKTQQEKQHQARQDRIDELKRRNDNNDIELNELKPKIKYASKKQIDEANKNIDLLEDKVFECRKKLRQTIRRVASNEETYRQLEREIKVLDEFGDVCDKCERPFEKEDKKSQAEKKKKRTDQKIKINDKIKSYNKRLKETEILKDRCSQAIDKQKNKIHNINIKINDNENIKNRMKQLKAWNKQIKIDIDELENSEDEFGEVITQTNDRVDELTKQLNTVRSEIEKLDVVKFVVSEEGVKSYIVKKILKVLNGKLAYYLKKLDAPCTCVFNEYFAETIINEKGQLCSYNNFSGGERRRVDLAILFTFMDIRRLQGDVSLNVSFYDEILDTSLDDKGVELFLEILKERVEKYDEAIHIISHKKEVVKHATNDIIYLAKRNNFTERIKYEP